MIAIILTSAALSAPASATSAERTWRACVDKTTTNFDWGQCGGRYIHQADAALNSEWKKVVAATDGNTRTDLIAEQRAWLVYRKNACDFYANGDWGREGHVLHYAGCVAGVIERRTRELADYIEFVGLR